MASSSLTKRPEVLYHASLEHVDALELLFSQRRWVLAIYVAGLAVECVLQAIALHQGSADDAKHDLRRWLRRCPASLQATIRSEAVEQWEVLNHIWFNPIRYLSRTGPLGRFKELGLDRGIKRGKDGNDAILKVNADKMIVAARVIHGKGVLTWQQVSSRK